MSIKKLIENRFDLDNFIIFLNDSFDDIDILDTRLRDDGLDSSDRVDVSGYRYLAEGFLVDDTEIGVLLLEASSPNIENKRVGFAKVINKLAKSKFQDILFVVIYHRDSDVWRLSFVSYAYKDAKQIANTDSKRYSFVLGKDIATTTAHIQLSTIDKNSRLQDIKDAFSVEAVTKEFFQDYKGLYFEICEYLSPQRALFDEEKNIKLFTKKLLGRIVFLYFLQKKGWLGSSDIWGDGDKRFLSNLFDNYQKDDFYSQILQEIFFEALNTKRKDDYFPLLECKMPFLNGGLFNKDEFDKLDLIIENSIFEKIFDTFNRYNFTIIEDNPHDSEVAIDPEMLGRVFEDLLEDRKDKGAFYTPREIVHYMCQQSLNNYLQDQKNNQDKLAHLKTIKVLDPAIGSGAFPMGMLHEILKLRQELGDTTPLGELKKEIIQNSIYGVDIEASAIEIAKLRFWLSIVVDEETPTPLPNLFYKIMVGNSLLETINGFDPFEKSKDNLFDDNSKVEEIQKLLLKYFNESNSSKKTKLQNQIDKIIDAIFTQKIEEYQAQIDLKSSWLSSKVKKEKDKLIKDIENDMHNLGLFQEIILQKPTTQLFFYKLYFADVMRGGGFDVVIGNPPYLRVQGVEKNISTRYKKAFKSATGSYDLYVLFSEKALALSKENGIVNFIMPHKWINSSFGKGLREITKDKVSKFISFGAYQVFNASTYTSLVWFQNKKVETLDYVESNRDLLDNQALEKYLFNLKDDDYTHIPNSNLTADSWVFTDKKTYKILQRLKEQPLRVSDVFEKIFQGIATSKDSVYFLKNCRNEDDLVIGFSEELNKEIEIEKGLVKPLLKGDNVHRYEKLSSDKVVIFPYYIADEKATLYTEKELKQNFPKGYKYLKACEDILRGRERGRFNIDGKWFQFGRKQGILGASKEKLIQPDISLGGNYSYDEYGSFYQTATLYGYIKYSHIKESYKFYIALLNSKLFWWFLKKTGTTLTNGYFRFKTAYINPFPLPKIENIEDTKPFEILVDYIMLLKTLDEPINEYVPNSHIIYQFEEVLDAMVYELYFKEEFESKLIQFEKEKGYIKFIEYAKEDYASIEGLDEDKSIEIIHQSYQTLRKPYNKIRNNLILIDIEFSEFIKPIKGEF